MKTILITVSEGSVARNILRSFVLDALLDKPDVRVVLVAPEEKVAGYMKEFGSERVVIAAWHPPAQTFLSRVLSYLSRNGIATETVLTDQRTRLLVDKRYVSFFIKRCVANGLGRFGFFQAIVRALNTLRRPSDSMRTTIIKYSPSVVFVTDVLDDLDIDAMAAARDAHITIVGMVRSWDNLSSGGLVLQIPDILLLWNQFLYDIAVRYQHISSDRLRIVGIPHYDWYTKKEIREDRASFLSSLGIDPQKKVILFGGIGNFLAPHESEVAALLSEAIEKGELPQNCVVLFRPHPNFLTERDQLKKLPHVVFDEGVAGYTSGEKTSWEMDQKKIAHLVNSLMHADVVVTTASTMTMDAVAFDKPVVCMAFDGKSSEPYWNSVLRFYRDYTHYIAMSRTRGFTIAYNMGELVSQIRAYLDNPEQNRAGREIIKRDFIYRLDGHSAQRVADAVVEYLTK